MNTVTKKDLQAIPSCPVPSFIQCAGCHMMTYKPRLWVYGLPACSYECSKKVRKETEKRMEEIDQKRDRR
jgi:hypothetical protein